MLLGCICIYFHVPSLFFGSLSQRGSWAGWAFSCSPSRKTLQSAVFTWPTAGMTWYNMTVMDKASNASFWKPNQFFVTVTHVSQCDFTVFFSQAFDECLHSRPGKCANRLFLCSSECWEHFPLVSSLLLASHPCVDEGSKGRLIKKFLFLRFFLEHWHFFLSLMRFKRM